MGRRGNSIITPPDAFASGGVSFETIGLAFRDYDLLQLQTGVPAASEVDSPEAAEHQQIPAAVIFDQLGIGAQVQIGIPLSGKLLLPKPYSWLGNDVVSNPFL